MLIILKIGIKAVFMVVNTSPSVGFYESSFFQNSTRKETGDEFTTVRQEKVIQTKSDSTQDYVNNASLGVAEESFSEFSTEKIGKLVKEFETKLLEQMGYSPDSLLKIKNLVESYRVELVAEMKEGFSRQMTNEVSAKSTLSTLLHMPTNTRTYSQELIV